MRSGVRVNEVKVRFLALVGSIKPIGIMAAPCFLLMACTTWVKPGATPSELDAVRTHCNAVSYATLPSAMKTTYGVGSSSYETRKSCEFYNSNGCIKNGDRYVAITKTTTDSNSSGRNAIFRDCMYQAGWRPE